MTNMTNCLKALNLIGVQRIGVLTKYLNGLVKNLIGYLTALISAKLEPGKIADVVVLEDVAAVELYIFDFKTIYILLLYFIQKPHNCEVFFEPTVFNVTL